jgi:hypothetical protein
VTIYFFLVASSSGPPATNISVGWVSGGRGAVRFDLEMSSSHTRSTSHSIAYRLVPDFSRPLGNDHIPAIFSLGRTHPALLVLDRACRWSQVRSPFKTRSGGGGGIGGGKALTVLEPAPTDRQTVSDASCASAHTHQPHPPTSPQTLMFRSCCAIPSLLMHRLSYAR